MNTKIRRVIAVSFFLYQSAFGALQSIYHAKGLSDPLDKSYLHLSPARGLMVRNSQYFQNLYLAGNPEHQTVKLLKTLYHSDGNSLQPTIGINNIARYLSISTLGEMINLLQGFTSDQLKDSDGFSKAVQEMEKTIQSGLLSPETLDLNRKKENLDFQVSQMKEKIVHTRQLRNSCAEGEERANLMKEVESLQKSLEESTLLSKEIQKQLVQVKKTGKNWSNTDIRQLSSKIVSSFLETLEPDRKYAPHMTEVFLQGLVLEKMQMKQDLLPYYEHLSKFTRKPLFKNLEEQKQWETGVYQDSELETWFTNLSKTPKDQFAQKIEQNPEISLVSMIQNRIHSNKKAGIPNFSDHKRVGYVDEDQKAVEYGDCGENTIRNLINFFILDGNGTYQAKYFKSEFKTDPALDVDEKVSSYYTTFQTDMDLTPDTRDEWNKRMSRLTGVKYSTNSTCQISQGEENLLKAISAVLFKNHQKEFSSLTQIDRWELLAKAFSRTGRMLTTKFRITRKGSVIEFSINGVPRAELNIETSPQPHFYLSKIEVPHDPSQENEPHLIFLSDLSEENQMKLRDFMAWIPQGYGEKVYKTLEKSADRNQFLFSNIIGNPNEVLSLVSQVEKSSDAQNQVFQLIESQLLKRPFEVQLSSVYRMYQTKFPKAPQLLKTVFSLRAAGQEIPIQTVARAVADKSNDFLKVLLENGAPINKKLRTEYWGTLNPTLMNLAVSKENLGAVEMLLDHHFDLKALVRDQYVLKELEELKPDLAQKWRETLREQQQTEPKDLPRK